MMVMSGSVLYCTVCVNVSLCWQIYVRPTLMPRELLNKDNSLCWKELRQEHSSLIYRIFAVFTLLKWLPSILDLDGFWCFLEFVLYLIWEEAIYLHLHRQYMTYFLWLWS